VIGHAFADPDEFGSMRCLTIFRDYSDRHGFLEATRQSGKTTPGGAATGKFTGDGGG
jgi:hypothetical protein